MDSQKIIDIIKDLGISINVKNIEIHTNQKDKSDKITDKIKEILKKLNSEEN